MSINPNPRKRYMTELRQKLITAVELKNPPPHTQRAYLAAALLGLAPATPRRRSVLKN